MTWVKFSERKPKIGSCLITKTPGWNKDSGIIEKWDIWDEQYMNLKPRPPSHWWEGMPKKR